MTCGRRTRRALRGAGVLAGWVVLTACSAPAHFQALLPSADIVSSGDPVSLTFDIRFTHPMERGPVMDMGEPAQFGVLAGGEHRDLKGTLKACEVGGKTGYTAEYKIRAPGDHVFYLEPAPYWEPAEQKMIIHYTKTIVNAYGQEEGWDAAVGFPVEIAPLVRPYGLWAGNIFRGTVLRNGRPAPHADVEVEYWNEEAGVEPPADPFVTQVVRADAQGVFSYAMPRAGWWGFAALVDGDEPMPNPDGERVDVELGGLLWVHCVEMK